MKQEGLNPLPMDWDDDITLAQATQKAPRRYALNRKCKKAGKNLGGKNGSIQGGPRGEEKPVSQLSHSMKQAIKFKRDLKAAAGGTSSHSNLATAKTIQGSVTAKS